jgi:hypothetical protein
MLLMTRPDWIYGPDGALARRNHEQNTWADGTLARYLTVGGATVDIIDMQAIDQLVYHCTGCDWNGHRNLMKNIDDTPKQIAERIAEQLPEVRRLSQAHAEKCRAMPRLDGTQ